MKFSIIYKITLIFACLAVFILAVSFLYLDTNRLKDILIAVFIFTILAAIVMSFIVSLFILGPIKEMTNVTRLIAKGDLTKRIASSRNDEIGDLARSFNNMSEQIRLRIAEALTNNSKMEAVFQSMFEGVIVIDEHRKILLMNKAIKDLLGIKEDVLGKTPLEVIRNNNIQEIVEKVLAIKKPLDAKEVGLFSPLDKVLLVNAVPVGYEGKPAGAVLVFHDITKLRQLENIRREFIANISHELRTPAANIKGYAETLLDGALNDKENAVEFLKIIYSESGRLEKLITDILGLSKIESEKFKMSLKKHSIKNIAETVSAEFGPRIKEKDLQMKINIADNLPEVFVDDYYIRQVFSNLIDNAIKYTDPKGSINITAHDKGKLVQVDVLDTGIGIPEQDIPRIFERFYRVDKARSRELGGTGLGLAIVKHIVQAHNGEVWVTSTAGKGSTFSFTIPKG